ncbi:helix-turn-helix transcriptional regulator [Alteromonas sp. IB21]|uniref:LuxR C-terminal-related transcriptional regulator n=1 Tax=Alteromonas sp. IB21 TaxID=2779369 RepID=UPI0018E7B5BE|nr:helix-turn-helix transcriptional regulator [Alteromonas sp. IB21]MBJ2129104.1 helix-turn-helix transcriptional regulator [Alteromonas sp. IB21]
MNLTPRQQQVYDLMIKGFSQRTAAKIIGFSVRSVKQHSAHIFKKLGVYSTREVVAQHYIGMGYANEVGMPGVELLSKAERRVYDQLVTGVGRKEIAARLFRAEDTVRFHLRNISEKLGTNSMLEIVIKHYTSGHEMREAA